MDGGCTGCVVTTGVEGLDGMEGEEMVVVRVSETVGGSVTGRYRDGLDDGGFGCETEGVEDGALEGLHFLGELR